MTSGLLHALHKKAILPPLTPKMIIRFPDRTERIVIMRALVAVTAGFGVLGLALWASSGPARAVAPSVEAGADIAARWCAACHVVAPSGAGTDAAPSFVSIAQKRTTEDLKVFLAKPHAKPMRGFTLTNHEIEDVAAYITTLDQKAEH